MALHLKSIGYRNQRVILRALNLSFVPGTIYGILGPNGSGKSTLMKVISGLLPASNGELLWNHTPFQEFSRREWSQRIAYVPQTLFTPFSFGVFSMVAMGLYARGVPRHLWEGAVMRSLEQVGAAHLRDRNFAELSGGEQQLVTLARALATEAPLILLDEPLAHLDLAHQLQMFRILRDLSAQGICVIVALHDLHMARRACDELILLYRGECIEQGPPEQALSPERLALLFGVKRVEGDFVLV